MEDSKEAMYAHWPDYPTEPPQFELLQVGKIQYKVVDHLDTFDAIELVQNLLDEAARDDWELIQVVMRSTRRYGTYYRYFFKRYRVDEQEKT